MLRKSPGKIPQTGSGLRIFGEGLPNMIIKDFKYNTRDWAIYLINQDDWNNLEYIAEYDSQQPITGEAKKAEPISLNNIKYYTKIGENITFPKCTQTVIFNVIYIIETYLLFRNFQYL